MHYNNIVDVLILSTITLLLFLSLVYHFAVSSISSPVGRFLLYTSIIILCIPQLGFFVYLLVKFYRSKQPAKWLQNKFVGFRNRHCYSSPRSGCDTLEVVAEERAGQEESLPDRLVNPEQYYVEMEDSQVHVYM